MKRKSGSQSANESPGATVGKPLRYNGNELFRFMHENGKDEKGRWKPIRRNDVNGIPLPENLEEIARDIGQQDADWFRELVSWERVVLPATEIRFLAGIIADAVEKGFALAVLRYAAELKHVPEAAAMLEANRKNAKKGGAARSKEAEPRRQQARRLDRELRKTVKKKYLRVQRIAAEMKVDTRTVERYLSPKK